MRIEAMLLLGYARYYMWRGEKGDIAKVIAIYKRVILNNFRNIGDEKIGLMYSQTSFEGLNKDAMDFIRDEFTWMKHTGLKGVDAVIEGIEMDKLTMAELKYLIDDAKVPSNKPSKLLVYLDEYVKNMKGIKDKISSITKYLEIRQEVDSLSDIGSIMESARTPTRTL